MTRVAVELPPPLRTLVDSRLDAIDRTLLLGGAPRPERIAVIEDVETQVQEMLGQRVRGQPPTRRDVIDVLAALDPPEAFIGEEGQALLPRVRAAQSSLAFAPKPIPPKPDVAQPSIIAIGSATAAVILLVLSLWLVALAKNLDMVGLMLAVFWFIAAVAVNAAGVLAIIRIRQSNGWLYGLPLALFAVLLLPMVLINGSLIVTVLLFQEIGLYAMVFVSWFFLNAVAVWQAWRWVSAGYTSRVLEASHDR